MPAPKGHLPYPGCETGGRPRLFSTEDIEKFADELLKWVNDETKYWLKDFFLEKGINPDFMSQWAKENEKFSGAYRLAKGIQESRIFKGAMTDSFNANMSKFALMNCHGWADKAEQKISGDAVNPLEFILNRIDGQGKDLVADEDEAE